MKNMNINHSNKTIEMNKEMQKATGVYGSTDYNNLIAVKRDFPDYNIVIVKDKSKKAAKETNERKGFTYDYMEKVISKKNDEAIMEEYLKMRGLDKEGNPIDESAPYNDILDWFKVTCPEYAELQEKRNEIMKRVEEKKQAAAAASKTNNIIEFYKKAN